jgi:hypothetical protein
MNYLYLDDYSNIEILKLDYMNENKNENMDPIINLYSDVNKKNEKIAVINISIPIKNKIITIDLLINNNIYKKIGKILDE